MITKNQFRSILFLNLKFINKCNLMLQFLHPSQPQMQSHLPMPPNVHAQGKNTMSHAVTVHHSYPQPLPHQNMQVGAPQSNMHLNPQNGQLQGQHSVQMQNQFPQQTPMMFPNQSHAMYPNQQLALLPSFVQGQSTPPLQPHLGYTPNQQAGQSNHRPILQPVQQILPQQPFSQHQTTNPLTVKNRIKIEFCN